MKIGCPIFPVGVVGTDTIQPPDAKAPEAVPECSIKIGRPIRPERYRNRGAEHIAWRSMIDEVMYEIRELTGQTYVNMYAGEQAETEPTVAARVASVTDAATRFEQRRAVDDRELRRHRRRDIGTDHAIGRAIRSNRTLVDPRPRRILGGRCPRSRFPSPTVPSACFAAPATPLDLAASIGSGLKKAAVAATVDGKETDLTDRAHRRRGGVDHHERHRRRPARPAPLDVARARPSGDAAVPRRQVLDRPRHRERLLLRLRTARTARRSATTTSTASRRACARSCRRTSRSHARRCR